MASAVRQDESKCLEVNAAGENEEGGDETANAGGGGGGMFSSSGEMTGVKLLDNAVIKHPSAMIKK